MPSVAIFFVMVGHSIHCGGVIPRLPVFPKGAQLYGDLPISGLGSHVISEDVPDLDGTWHQCVQSNHELLASLKEDANAKALHQITLDDFAKGRMSEPAPVETISHCKARMLWLCVVLILALCCAGPNGSPISGHPGDKCRWLFQNPGRGSHVMVGTFAARPQKDAETGMTFPGLGNGVFFGALTGQVREHKRPLRCA